MLLVPVETSGLTFVVQGVGQLLAANLLTFGQVCCILTEVGAEQVGVIQSLLTTCRLQGVDPYTYLVDVLQRIDCRVPLIHDPIDSMIL